MSRATFTLIFGLVGALCAAAVGALGSVALAYHSETIGVIVALSGAIGTIAGAGAAYLKASDTPPAPQFLSPGEAARRPRSAPSSSRRAPKP